MLSTTSESSRVKPVRLAAGRGWGCGVGRDMEKLSIRTEGGFGKHRVGFHRQNIILLRFASGLGACGIPNNMKSLFAYTAVLFAAATLSAAVVNGGGTGTGTVTPTTPVVTPTKPVSGTCDKPSSKPAAHPKKSAEVKGEKKGPAKPAPIKSAAPACKKK